MLQLPKIKKLASEVDMAVATRRTHSFAGREDSHYRSCYRKRVGKRVKRVIESRSKVNKPTSALFK